MSIPSKSASTAAATPCSWPRPANTQRIASPPLSPMDRIFFGNADSGGPESLTSEAVRLSQVGVEWADLVLAGKPGAKELVEKALAPAAD